MASRSQDAHWPSVDGHAEKVRHDLRLERGPQNLLERDGPDSSLRPDSFLVLCHCRPLGLPQSLVPPTGPRPTDGRRSEAPTSLQRLPNRPRIRCDGGPLRLHHNVAHIRPTARKAERALHRWPSGTTSFSGRSHQRLGLLFRRAATGPRSHQRLGLFIVRCNVRWPRYRRRRELVFHYSAP